MSNDFYTGFLTTIVFLPLMGALAALLLAKDAKQARWMAALFTGATLVLAIIMFAAFDRSAGAARYQFVERYSWFPAFNVHYFMGVDGLSAPMVLLTALLGFASVFVSWNIQPRAKEHFFWLLVLETGVLGVFVSLDFLMFFLFWEVELLPMYMLISVWGGGRKEYSALKFLLFTILGSAFMLVGILVLYFSTGTFDMTELAKMHIQTALVTTQAVFFLLLAAFAVKLPIFPFHTWLPDAHTDAPTAGSVMLAGVLLKMGGYGIIRVCVDILPGPAQQYAGLLAAFAVVNILYGAFVVLWQKDLKRLIAYSSVSHMGFVLLGVSSMGQVGLTGAALQMFTHGTITALLFMLVGLVYDKTHSRQIPDLGGLAPRMPMITIMFMVAGLASLGLPLLSGFVAELTVFLGTFEHWRAATILSTFGVVLGAGYVLWMVQRVMFGPAKERFAKIGDATLVETLPLAAMAAAIIVIGIYPAFMTDVFRIGIEHIVPRFG